MLSAREQAIRPRGVNPSPRVSVVIPCLDEADTIAECVSLVHQVLAENSLPGEVIVVDNGSTDGSAGLARAAGATVVEEPRRGYGRAYLTGLAHARGEFIFMADADLSYDFREIPRFVHELENGAELVIGNRMKGIRPGAMPWLNQHIGNPLLSRVMKVLCRTSIGDVWCGMRAFRRDVLPKLDLHGTGMEFAPEMVMLATRQKLKVSELPIELHPRGGGASKLSAVRDGWGHLRLMLVYSPNFLFLLPAALMILLGAVAVSLVLVHATLFGQNFYVHTLIGGAFLTLLGVQGLGFGLCARAYSVYFIGERDDFLEAMRARFKLEHGLAFAAALVGTGLALGGVVIGHWASRGFGTLSEERLAILAGTLVVAGVQVFFTSFLLAILGLRRRW
jgi:glycosyltransferase involved in cell wall biosynthesis